MNDLFDEPRTKASSDSNSTSTQNGPPEIKSGEHACTICGAPAYFGFGVKLRAGLHAIIPNPIKTPTPRSSFA